MPAVEALGLGMVGRMASIHVIGAIYVSGIQEPSWQSYKTFHPLIKKSLKSYPLALPFLSESITQGDPDLLVPYNLNPISGDQPQKGKHLPSIFDIAKVRTNSLGVEPGLWGSLC